MDVYVNKHVSVDGRMTIHKENRWHEEIENLQEDRVNNSKQKDIYVNLYNYQQKDIYVTLYNYQQYMYTCLKRKHKEHKIWICYSYNMIFSLHSPHLWVMSLKSENHPCLA